MTRSDDELRRAAHHVAHDIRMLGRSFDRHQHDPFAYTAWFVHCRSVMEFFRESTENNDDIIVSHFLSQGLTWKRLVQGTKKPAGYKETRCAVNKLAAHLTYTRLDYETGGCRESQGLPSEEITNYLLSLACLFVDALPPERTVWFGGIWR